MSDLRFQRKLETLAPLALYRLSSPCSLSIGMFVVVRTFANETLGVRGRMGSRVRENDGDGECGSVMVTNLSAIRVCRVASFLETTKHSTLSRTVSCLLVSFVFFLSSSRRRGPILKRAREGRSGIGLSRFIDFFRASSA